METKIFVIKSELVQACGLHHASKFDMELFKTIAESHPNASLSVAMVLS